MEKQEITLENILERYKDTAGPGDQQAVIALLREVQQLYGCVPDSVQQRVAKATGTAPSLIAALVRRVPGLTPVGLPPPDCSVHRPALLGKRRDGPSARCGKCPGNRPRRDHAGRLLPAGNPQLPEAMRQRAQPDGRPNALCIGPRRGHPESAQAVSRAVLLGDHLPPFPHSFAPCRII